MNLFDLLAVILIVALAISGLREGLLRGGIKLIGFLVSLLAISLFAGRITRFALGIDGIPGWAAVPLMFTVVMIALNLFFSVIAEILHRTVHLTPLGVIDSGLGLVFGALKGVFVMGIVALVLSFLPGKGFLPGQYAASRMAPPLAGLIERIIPAAVTAGYTVLKHLSPSVAPDRRGAPERKDNARPNHESEYYI